MKPRDLYGPVDVADSAVIGEYCVLGCPKESRLRAWQHDPDGGEVGARVTVGERCLLFNQVVLFEGVRLGEDCVLEDQVRVGYDTTVGPHTRLAYGAYVCDRVTIGAHTRIAGFICDGTRIGERSSVMGDLVHEYASPHRDWWVVDEAPPEIGPDSVVGYGARVVGGVTIGPRSFVAAGAIVTKDVPPEHVAVGVNVQVPAASWSGRRLGDLIRHWTTLRPALP